MSVSRIALSSRCDESLNYSTNSIRRLGMGSNDPILVYVTVDGSVIPMRILQSDSIASVKLQIQASKGFFAKKQKLVFEGRELARNDTCVRDYGVAEGTVLHLVLRLADLQAIKVRTVQGKEFEFHVERSQNVGYVKQKIAEREGGFVDLRDQKLIRDGEELEDQSLINDICKRNDAMIHLLVRKSAKVRSKPFAKDLELSIEGSDSLERADLVTQCEWVNKFSGFQITEKKRTQKDFLLEPVITSSTAELSPVIKNLIDSTRNGLERGNKPIRSSEGTGGAYFMRDSSGLSYISVFKPIDEEPMAVNNPRGLPLSADGEGLKKGTRVGEGAMREVAAYLLDRPRDGPRIFYSEKGFSGVPPTVMIKCLHRGFNHPKGYEFGPKYFKFGSLQMFMKNEGSCEEMGFAAFPVNEVHKITVLDIRLANADRHAGNILVQKDDKGAPVTLIPIDHGYCLPENFEDCTFEWLYWPQARQPYSAETLDYIRSLDAEQDLEILKLHGCELPPECALNLRISTMLLKKGAERGLTPFAIGRIMCRETLKKESVIEQIIQESNEAVLPGTSEAAFLESVSSIMDRRLDELSK